MTDKIPSFKDQIDDIHVPTEKLDDIIFKTVQEHAPKRKKSLRSKFVYTASAAVVAFGLLVGSATVSPVMADIVSKIPVIGAVFSESNDAGLEQVSKLGFTQLIGESKQVDDKILTIEEAFYDGVRLTVSYYLTTETPIAENYFSLSPSYKIDGQAYDTVTFRAENDITPTYHTGLLEIEIRDPLPDYFNLDLVFGGRDGNRWEFSVPIEMNTNVEVIEINHKQQVAGVNLIVTEISNGVGGLKLKYEIESTEDDGLSKLHLGFHIEDHLENDITHPANMGQLMGEGTNKKQIGSISFNPVDEHVKDITITPYFTLSQEATAEDKEKFKAFEHETFESFTVKLSN